MPTIYGTNYNDNNTVGSDGNFHPSIIGTDEAEYIYGKGGDDVIYAQGGDDVVFADDSNNQDGNDYIDGGNGNDALYGFGGNDVIIGGQGDDAVVGYGGNDELYGGDGNDTLGDWYHGEPGNDYLVGGTGNDVLYGYGRGADEHDTLVGGDGADKFVLGHETTTFLKGEAYYLGSGYATIVDFHRSQSDKIQVYGNKSDYSFDKSHNFSGTSALDTAIYYKGDLIAVVEDKTYITRTQDFTFVS